MRSRGLVVAIAVILAIAAAGAVILYTKGVKQDAVSGGALAVVVVSSQDIPANTDLNPLLNDGVFSQLQVPTDAVVDGAVTSVDELRGQTSTAPILANEQISPARLSSGEEAPGGPLGISPGHIGLATEVDLERGVAGSITTGAHVAVYATFSEGTAVRKATLRQLLSPAQLDKFTATLEDGTVATGTPVVRIGVPFTVVLVPSVRVLSVENPTVDDTGKSTGNSVMTTLDLQPDDASNLVYAKEVAVIWFGMLPPENEDGYPVQATFGPSFETVVGTAK